MSNKTEPITASQLHYTSARYGYAGNAGYRVRALTESINEEEQRILATMGNYGNPPRDLPDAPSHSQIVELFPKAYRSIFLDSGKFAVTYSFYVGLDYSNRSGNYFVHGLIIDQLPDNIWPIDIYNWQGWKQQFEVDEDHEQQSFILPVANIEYPKQHEGYSLSDLQEFLQETGEKSHHLNNMIRAVLLRQENSRALVIREEMEYDGLFWIACIQKAFPATHQYKLSCSSYQFDPSNCSAVNITLENTNFILGETEREYQFYVFDFVGDEYSQMEQLSNDYAEIIANWMLTEPEKLSDFHQFSYWFKHQNLNEELIWMLRLFQLNSGEIFNFDENELSQILAFANSFTTDDKVEQVLDIISQNTQDLVNTDDFSIIIILISFFIKAAKQTKNNKYLTQVYKLLMHLYYAHWFKGNHAIKEEIIYLRTEAQESFDSFEEQFAFFFLSEENQSELFDIFCYQKPEIFSEIIEFFISSIKLTNKPVSFKNGELNNFIQRTLDNNTNFGSLDWLFKFFMSNHDAVVELVAVVITIIQNDVTKQEQFSTYFTNLLAKQNNEYRFSIINTLKLDNCLWLLLISEWQNEIKQQKNKIQAYSSYQKNVLNDNSDFTKKYFYDFSEQLWLLLNKKEKQLQAIQWINDETINIFSEPFIKDIIQMASNIISFNPNDKISNSDIELLEKTLREKKIQLRPDRLFLRQEILKLENKKFNFSELDISNIPRAIEGIEKKEYADFISNYLPHVLNKLTDEKQHERIIKNILIRAYLEEFTKAYKTFFQNRNKNSFSSADFASLNFWLSLEKKDKHYSFFEPLSKSSFNLMVSRVASMNEKPYAILSKKMENDLSLSNNAKNNWRELDEQVKGKREGFLKNLMKRLFQ